MVISNKSHATIRKLIQIVKHGLASCILQLAGFHRICIAIFVFASIVFRLNAQQEFKEGFARMQDSTSIYFRIFGEKGDTLIFLHGGPGQNMYGVGPDLVPLSESFVLIMYDQRGSGNSEIGDTSILTAGRHVEDLEELRKYFSINKMTIIGQSWGAMLAAMYTGKYTNNVKRLLLLSPGPPTREQFDERFAVFLKIDSAGQGRVAKLRSQLLKSENPMAVCAEIHSTNEKLYFADHSLIKKRKGDYCMVTPEAIHRQAITASLTLRSLGQYDLRPILKLINQPVLIIEGAKTPVPLSEFYIWKESLPNSRLIFFDKTGHGYPFVEEAKKFFKTAKKYLKGKWPVN